MGAGIGGGMRGGGMRGGIIPGGGIIPAWAKAAQVIQ